MKRRTFLNGVLGKMLAEGEKKRDEMIMEAYEDTAWTAGPPVPKGGEQ